MEARKAKRYRVQAPVFFSWADSNGVTHKGSGNSVDMSTIGIFVICKQPAPPLHSPVTVQVMLPNLEKRGLCVKGSGEVVRLEGTPESPAFAFAASQFIYQQFSC